MSNESNVSQSVTAFDMCATSGTNVAQFYLYFNPHQTDVSESLIRRGGGKYAPQRKWPILAIFLHSMQQKWDQVTQGRQMLTLIGSRTRLGPSMDPTGPLK